MDNPSPHTRSQPEQWWDSTGT